MDNYGELGYLLAQRRAGMGNQGAAELGALLGGGGRAREQQIFNQSALQGARMQDVLAQARQRQQQSINIENLARRAEKNGDSELAAVLRASHEINPNTYYEGMGHKQGNDFRQKAWDVAQSPNRDWGALNSDLAVINGKPVQVQRTLGNGMYTTNAYDPATTPVVSDIGKALIGEHNAQAGAANAAAAQHYAQAGAAKALQDQRTGKVPSAAKSKPFTVGELSAAFGDGQHIDPEQFARFQSYRNDAPSDTAAFLQMRNDDQTAQEMGPPSDLAPPKPGIMDGLASFFGGGNSQTGNAAQPTAKIATPQSQADFDALPSGATYVNPADGKTYRKK